MLSMKNLLSRAHDKDLTAPALPAAPSPAAEALVKGRQLLRGRTRAKVEALTAQLEAANASATQLKQRVGECVVDERDATTLMEELRQAEARVHALEAALAVAIQKDEDVQGQLRQAERQGLDDAVAEAETRLNARGPEGERLFTTLEEFCRAVARDKEALRLARVAAGVEPHFVDVAELPREFGRAAARAGHPLTGTGLRPSRLMPFASWIACVEKVCGVKA